MKRRVVCAWSALCALLVAGLGLPADRSPDRSATWTQLGPAGGNITAIARNPKSPSELYAVSERGLVYRSVNNGKNWTRKAALDAYAYDLVLDPKDPRTIYILGSSSLFKSVDQGTAFSTLSFGQYRSGYLGRIAVNPQNPKIIIVAGAYTYKTSNWYTCLAVIVTKNGGQTWSHKALEATSSYAYGRDVAINPKNPSTIFFCGSFYDGSYYRARVYRSTNGGSVWKNVTPAFMNADKVHSYAYAIAVDPANPSHVLVSYESYPNSGVAISSTSGTTWKKTNPSSIYYLECLAFDKTHPTTVYGGALKDVWKSANGGANWTKVGTGFAGIASKILASGSTVHVASDAGVFRSVNGGKSVLPSQTGILATNICGFRMPGSSSLTTAPAASTAYAAATYVGVFKSANACAGWTKLPDFLGSDDIARLAVPSSDPNRVYLSTYG